MDASCYQLVCATCGKCYDPSKIRYLCSDCSIEQVAGTALRGVLEVSYDFDRLKTQFNASFLDASKERGTRRYLPLLPISRGDLLSPLLVGDTPMYGGGRLGEHLGMRGLFLKDESSNPAGSYKDRASILVVAKALEIGAQTVCAASTGNAASALACICASQGVDCVVVLPESAPPAKLAQILVYGARVFPVRCNYDRAFDLSTAACERLGWYNRNTAYNPYTIDGKRLAAFEIWEQMGRSVPDSVWIPSGDGVILSGVAKGFRDLMSLGLSDRIPQIIAVQAAGSPALVRALENGKEQPDPVPGASSVADSIVVEAPRNGILALRDIRRSGGRGVTVTDEEILSALALCGRLAGLFVEPSAAAAVAGIVKERRAGRIARDERAVVLLTGGGLKDIEAARMSVILPNSIEADIDALIHAVSGE